jgi:hypothetical protein
MTVAAMAMVAMTVLTLRSKRVAALVPSLYYVITVPVYITVILR